MRRGYVFDDHRQGDEMSKEITIEVLEKALGDGWLVNYDQVQDLICAEHGPGGPHFMVTPHARFTDREIEMMANAVRIAVDKGVSGLMEVRFDLKDDVITVTATKEVVPNEFNVTIHTGSDEG